MRRTLLGLAVIVTLLAAVSTALSAGTQSPGAKSSFYTLRKDSTYENGCFGPCMCPVMIQGPVGGGFRLTFAGSDGTFDNYLVEDVKWVVHTSNQELHVTGSGTYRIGGQLARQHELSLDLQVGGDPVQHFDSGLVTPPTPFPSIDARISINGEYCFDTVFGLHARPVRDFFVDSSSLSWDPAPPVDGHDIVRGSLRALLLNGGDFRAAVQACAGNDLTGDSLALAGDPPPGEGYWFLLRDLEGTAVGSFDSGAPDQVGSSDDGIAASSASCP
jgi:hypothetical protein